MLGRGAGAVWACGEMDAGGGRGSRADPPVRATAARNNVTRCAARGSGVTLETLGVVNVTRDFRRHPAVTLTSLSVVKVPTDVGAARCVTL